MRAAVQLIVKQRRKLYVVSNNRREFSFHVDSLRIVHISCSCKMDQLAIKFSAIHEKPLRVAQTMQRTSRM